jgi:hypothetical protein
VSARGPLQESAADTEWRDRALETALFRASRCSGGSGVLSAQGVLVPSNRWTTGIS